MGRTRISILGSVCKSLLEPRQLPPGKTPTPPERSFRAIEGDALSPLGEQGLFEEARLGTATLPPLGDGGKTRNTA